MAGGWDIRRVYLYLVSFATLMMMIIGAVVFFQGFVNLVYPDPQNNYELKMNRPYPDKAGVQPSEAEIKEEARHWQAQQRYNNIKQMINSSISIIVALPVYMYHWRRIRRAEVTP